MFGLIFLLRCLRPLSTLPAQWGTELLAQQKFIKQTTLQKVSLAKKCFTLSTLASLPGPFPEMLARCWMIDSFQSCSWKQTKGRRRHSAIGQSTKSSFRKDEPVRASDGCSQQCCLASTMGRLIKICSPLEIILIVHHYNTSIFGSTTAWPWNNTLDANLGRTGQHGANDNKWFQPRFKVNGISDSTNPLMILLMLQILMKLLLRYDGHAAGHLTTDKLSTRNLQSITCQVLLGQKAMLQLLLERWTLTIPIGQLQSSKLLVSNMLISQFKHVRVSATKWTQVKF